MIRDLAHLRAYQVNPNVIGVKRVLREGESLQTDDAYRLRYHPTQRTYFDSFAEHPKIFEKIPNDAQGRSSSAAGAFQFTWTTWRDEVEPELRRLFGRPIDFSPAMQEAGAIILFDRTGKSLQQIVEGKLEEAMVTLRGRWTSLPGAAENRRLTVAKARAIYEAYGGKYELVTAPDMQKPPTQPAAPIDDRSTEAPPVGVNQPEGASMGAGLLAAILPQVLQLFTGKAQQKIAETTGASPDIAAQFMQALIGKVGLAVGVPVINDATATQAVGTFASKADPAAIKALEADALMSLDELLRVTDRASEYDKIKWQAEMDGRDAAARRAMGERWDMTPWLVGFAGSTVTLMILGLVGAILYQSIVPGKGIDPVLLGLGGPLLGIGFACYKAIFDYRFDGTKDSGAQSDALMKVVADRNQPTGGK